MLKRACRNAGFWAIIRKSHRRCWEKRFCQCEIEEDSSLSLKRSCCGFVVPQGCRSSAKSDDYPPIEGSSRFCPILPQLEPASNQIITSRQNLLHSGWKVLLALFLQINHHRRLRWSLESLQLSLPHSCKVRHGHIGGLYRLPRSSIHKTLRWKSGILDRHRNKKDNRRVYGSNEHDDPETRIGHQKVRICLCSLAE